MPHVVRLPQVYGTATIAGQGGMCGMSAFETAVYDLMLAHPEQRRVGMACHPILAQVARARAQDMANRQYLAHVNPDGDGPCILVSRAGYKLPDGWTEPRSKNQIESIAGGGQGLEPVWMAAWDAWMGSPGHRRHILGTDDYDFYRQQTNVGVGHAFVPRGLGHYWSILTAPPEEV